MPRQAWNCPPTLVFDYPATDAMAVHLASLLPASPAQSMPPSLAAETAVITGDASVTVVAGAVMSAWLHGRYCSTVLSTL